MANRTLRREVLVAGTAEREKKDLVIMPRNGINDQFVAVAELEDFPVDYRSALHRRL
jgi:hypothetical protein